MDSKNIGGRPKNFFGKTKNVQFRLTESELRELENLAKSNNISRSQLIRDALEIAYGIFQTDDEEFL